MFILRKRTKTLQKTFSSSFDISSMRFRKLGATRTSKLFSNIKDKNWYVVTKSSWMRKISMFRFEILQLLRETRSLSPSLGKLNVNRYQPLNILRHSEIYGFFPVIGMALSVIMFLQYFFCRQLTEFVFFFIQLFVNETWLHTLKNFYADRHLPY